MNKYEIMMIVDPKVDAKIAFDLLSEVFGKGVKKAEKLENTELAYEINKSKQGQYILASVESDSKNPAEFTRRTNIIKGIWRALVINLDSEKGLKPKKESKAKAKRTYVKKEFNKSTSEDASAEKAKRRPRTVKPVDAE